MKIPALCICRGMQVMNVAYGGTLPQHLPDRPGLLEHGVPLDGTETLHTVTPEPASYLAAVTKSGDLTCPSHHHQGVERVGDRLRVTGRSPDGLVEAIELDVGPADDPTTEPWIVGVQWHPEETAEADPAQQSLFDALVLLARLRGSRAKPGDPVGAVAITASPTRIRAGPSGTRPRPPASSARSPPTWSRASTTSGSTAVAGLPAKPIVDIQLSLSTMVPRGAYVEPLRALGYRWVLDPWDVEHETFSRDIGGERSFHLHVCAAGSTWERRHLVFRDWLRTHPDDAAAYGTLKRELAAAHPNDTLPTRMPRRLHLRHRRTGRRTDDRRRRPGRRLARCWLMDTPASWGRPSVARLGLAPASSVRRIVGDGTNA